MAFAQLSLILLSSNPSLKRPSLAVHYHYCHGNLNNINRFTNEKKRPVFNTLEPEKGSYIVLTLEKTLRTQCQNYISYISDKGAADTCKNDELIEKHNVLEAFKTYE